MNGRAWLLAAIPLAIGLGLSAAPRQARAYCYYVCSLYKEGECVEHRSGCYATGPAYRGAAARRYGAIAFSMSTGRYGYSDHYAGEAAASQRALAQCGSRDCQVAVWFYNRRGALAVGVGNAWGAAHRPTAAAANAVALATCRKWGGGRACHVTVSDCSG